MVIADTSVLQYLHQIDRLHLLTDLYGTIRVPEGVVEEIDEGRERGYDLPDVQEIDWIEVVALPHRKSLLLAAGLGKGEREVLSLAAEQTQALVLLDDRAAREAAKHLGIACTGLLGVLLYAKEEGRLDDVETTIELLKGCGFRLSEELRRETLRLAGEV